MTGRRLPPGNHGFGDLRVADYIETDSREITLALIDDFAEMTGDRFAIHMSDEAARAMGFPCRVAHGLLVLSVIDGLKNNTPAQFRALASLGWDWAFSAPVLAGDSVQARLTVEAMRPTSDGRRGILTLAVEVRNQRGEIVQRGHNRLMVWR